MAALSLDNFIYAFLAGLLPSLIWLFFWTHEDTHPEPRWVLAACFLGGMLSVGVAIAAEQYIAGFVSDPNLRYAWWAALEEIIKYLVVAGVALHVKSNDEPIDAMMYCLTVALGFAAVENALFIMGPLSLGEVARSLVTGNMRFIGATLVHVVSSAIIGFTLGYVFYRGIVAKFAAVVVGLLGAIALHTAFNISIANAGPADALKTFGWIWGAVVALIVLFEEVKAVQPSVWQQ